jgi:hypothetical protein
VKRSGRDGPIWVAIHIYMRPTQRISLDSYLHLKLAKTPCFSYYVSFSFFNKITEQEGGISSAWMGEKKGGDTNTVYTHK